MGYHDYRFFPCQVFNSVSKLSFVFGIDICSSFVEYNNRRILHNRSCYGYSLFLASRECSAALTNDSIVAVWQ